MRSTPLQETLTPQRRCRVLAGEGAVICRSVLRTMLAVGGLGVVICFATTVPGTFSLDWFDIRCPKPDCNCPPAQTGPAEAETAANDGGACASCSGNGPIGMPRWWVSEPAMNLWITDEPLGYQPSVGPRVSFLLNYKQREDSAGYNSGVCNVGTNWNIFWVSYVADEQVSVNNYHLAHVQLGKGGRRTMIPDGVTMDYYTGLKITRLTDTNSNTLGFDLLYPDGSKDVYTSIPHVFAGAAFTNYFLTAKVDPYGNALSFKYDAAVAWAKLQYVVDADGRTNTVDYADNDHPYRITRVTDPFGRSVELHYDYRGLLTSIIDVANLRTDFSYVSSNAWITAMVTPYGTNEFRFSDSRSATNLNGRSVEITEPDGNRQLFVYRDGLVGALPGSYPVEEVPVTAGANFEVANHFDNAEMYNRNSFHWSRNAFQYLSTNYVATGNISNLIAADYGFSRVRHWLKAQDGSGLTGHTLSMERLPGPTGGPNGLKTWYDYEDKPSSDTEGPAQILPCLVARVLPDGTTQFTRTPRNRFGLATEEQSTFTRDDGTVDLRMTRYQYGSNDVDLVLTTNPLGVQVSSNWFNDYHRVLTNFNALNEQTVWYYNGKQQVAGVRYPDGLITTNDYNEFNQLVSTVDLAFVGPDTIYYRTNTFAYATNLVAVHVDELGAVTRNYYDNLQRLIAVVDDRGTNRYSYNKLDLAQFVDRMGHTNSYGYNRVRQKVMETNALGTVTAYGYCLCGSPSYVTNALGTALESVTQFDHDLLGRTTYVLYPDKSSFNYLYDSLGRLTNVVDSAGHITARYYNNQGLIAAAINYNGTLLASAYDVLDRPTNIVDANGVSMAQTFDDLDRLRTRTYPDGGAEAFGYSPDISDVTSYTNQLGTNVVNYFFDPLGRKVKEVYPGMATNGFAYDASGNVTNLTDANGHNTSWTYDAFGRVVAKTDDNGATMFAYAYYPTDWISNRVDAASRSTTYTYDAAGDLTAIVYLKRTNSYAYDALGRLTNMLDQLTGASLASSYRYNNRGFLESEDGPWPADTVTMTYENHQLRGLSLEQPDGPAWSQTYGYDLGNRLSTVASGSGTFTYAYKAAGLAVTNLALPNGAAIATDFDSVGRLIGTVLQDSSGGILNSHRYGYNLAGQRVAVTNTLGNYMTFAYDNLNQLKTARGREPGGVSRLNEQFGYAYDAAGNLNYRTNNDLVTAFNVNSLNQLNTASRTGTMTVSGRISGAAGSVTVNGSAAVLYQDNTFARPNVPLVNGLNTFNAIATDGAGRRDANSITVNLPSAVNFIYDVNGNLASDGRRGFEYDDENQLTRVTLTNVWMTEFTYDGLFRRRIRREYAWTGGWALAAEVRYVYDGNLVLEERDGNNTPVVTYTRGLDLSGTFRGAGGIGGLLARTDTAHAYYHADGNGNITALIGPDQSVVARYAYDPFGDIASAIGPLAQANTYRFSSQEYHENSGLVLYLYRAYEPNLQRWLTRDPIEENERLNMYSFVRNNPIDLSDYFGLHCNVTIRRYVGSAGHQWISDGKNNIGFYPGKMFGAAGGGVWINEDQFTQQVNANGGSRPDPSDSNNYYEWYTKKRRRGRLRDGTPCASATCQQIIDCINKSINALPAPKFNPLLNNCRQQSKRTLGDCCLSQGTMDHYPPGGKSAPGRSISDSRGGLSELTR